MIPSPGEYQRHDGVNQRPLVPSSEWIPACAGMTYRRASDVCYRPNAVPFKRTRYDSLSLCLSFLSVMRLGFAYATIRFRRMHYNESLGTQR